MWWFQWKKHKSERFRWFLTFSSQILALFEISALCFFTKYNNFLPALCWFLVKNLANFVSLHWKLDNPHCHCQGCQDLEFLFRCFLTFSSQILSLFEISALCFFTKYNNFLPALCMSVKNLANFVSLLWKLDNSNCHSQDLEFWWMWRKNSFSCRKFGVNKVISCQLAKKSYKFLSWLGTSV